MAATEEEGPTHVILVVRYFLALFFIPTICSAVLGQKTNLFPAAYNILLTIQCFQFSLLFLPPLRPRSKTVLGHLKNVTNKSLEEAFFRRVETTIGLVKYGRDIFQFIQKLWIIED